MHSYRQKLSKSIEILTSSEAGRQQEHWGNDKDDADAEVHAFILFRLEAKQQHVTDTLLGRQDRTVKCHEASTLIISFQGGWVGVVCFAGAAVAAEAFFFAGAIGESLMIKLDEYAL
jgi:hypothetical protein